MPRCDSRPEPTELLIRFRWPAPSPSCASSGGADTPAKPRSVVPVLSRDHTERMLYLGVRLSMEVLRSPRRPDEFNSKEFVSQVIFIRGVLHRCGINLSEFRRRDQECGVESDPDGFNQVLVKMGGRIDIRNQRTMRRAGGRPPRSVQPADRAD